MSERICPKCDGEGHIKNRGEQVFLGLFTFGLGPAIDAILNPDTKDSVFGRECPLCQGHGFLRFRSRPPAPGDAQ